jgi:hypothetical protein
MGFLTWFTTLLDVVNGVINVVNHVKCAFDSAQATKNATKKD